MATARAAKVKDPAALIRPLVTPEGVDLRVKLADAGTRASGFLLDVVIIIVAAVVVSLVALFGLGGLGVQDAEPLFIVWIIFIFFLRLFEGTARFSYFCFLRFLSERFSCVINRAIFSQPFDNFL